MPEEASSGLAVAIDREACLGTGLCIVYARHTLAHDDETTAVVQDLPHDAPRGLRTAVRACPVGALSLPGGPAPE